MRVSIFGRASPSRNWGNSCYARTGFHGPRQGVPASPSGRGDKSLLQVKCLRPRSRLTFLAIVDPVRRKMKKTLKLKRLAFTLSDRHRPKSRVNYARSRPARVNRVTPVADLR